MSLEQAIADLGNKIDENSALLRREIELREQGLAHVAAAADKVAASSTKATKAQKEEAPAKTEAKGDDQTEAAKTKIAEYVGGTDREEERKARKLKVRNLLNHEKIKKPDAPENHTDLQYVKPDALGAVIKNIQKLIDAGDVTKPATSDDDDIDI